MKRFLIVMAEITNKLKKATATTKIPKDALFQNFQECSLIQVLVNL